MLRKTTIVLAKAASTVSPMVKAAVKPLLRGEQGCKLMVKLSIVVDSQGNLEAVLPAASALAKRHVDYRQPITRPLARRRGGRWGRV
jgi:hypothetical protein